MTNKKILIEGGALAQPRTSGIGNTALNIIRTLAQDDTITENFTIHIIVPFNKARYLERYKFDKSIVVRKLWLPGKVSNLLTKLRAMPYMDVFFGKGVYIFPNYKNWPLFHSKSITYVHDMAHIRHPEFIEPKNLKYLNNHLKEWIDRADRIVTVSTYSQKEIEEYFPESIGKVLTVYNGYDTNLFHPNAYNEAVTKKYNLVRNKYFIFLSNLEPRKNITTLLNAFKIHLKNNPDHQLLLVGGMGWKNEDILQAIAEMNSERINVIYPSMFVPDEDLPSLICGSIGLVHPAHYEGFGISPLQALACGKHVVVGNNSSLPEVVAGAGLYVDVNDPEAVSRGMQEIVNSSDQINVEGLKRAEQFHWENVLSPLKIAIRECAEDIY